MKEETSDYENEPSRLPDGKAPVEPEAILTENPQRFCELVTEREDELNDTREADGDDHPYFVSDGVINLSKFIKGRYIEEPLCNFNARIIGEEVHDDGIQQTNVFVIEGSRRGKHLQRIKIPAEPYQAMSWVTASWGAQAVVYAGFGVKEHLRAAIQLLSGDIPRRTVFEHLGWRKIEGRWFYLHDGGGIGKDGLNPDIKVELEHGHLRNYILPSPPDGDELRESIKASLSIEKVARHEITIPMQGGLYRAPLGEAAYVDLSLFLVGPTGSQKSELSALAQAHFGANFHGKNLPGNWSTTSNTLEKMSFLLKDAVFVVDDFAPTGTTSDVQRLHREADRLLRSQGNRAGRGRMRPDGSLRREYYPQGVIISSGEDIPRGQSLRARIFTLEVSPGDVDLDQLTAAQENAANGKLAQCMSGYVRWLAPQIEDLKKILPARQRELRTEARKYRPAHDRTPDIVASLGTGWETFLQFAEESEAISADEADTVWKEIWEVLNEVSKSQSEQMLSEEPTRRFVDLISAALSSGMAHVADIDTNNPPSYHALNLLGWKGRIIDRDGDIEWVSQGQRIGWLDNDDLYLDPESAFAVVQDLTRRQGTSFAITQTTLWKRLDEKGLLASREPSQRNYTVRRKVTGTRKRVIHLKVQEVIGYKSSPNSPNGPEKEKAESFGQHTSCQFPPRRKRSGPQSSPSDQGATEASSEVGTETTNNGSDATETGVQTLDQPSSGPVWTTGQEEVVQEK